MSKFKQYDDYETSTRVCPCGERITWSGASEELEAWMKVHQRHVDDGQVVQIETEDGKRAE